MALKSKTRFEAPDRPSSPSAPMAKTWDRSVGQMLAGRAYLDEADATAAQMEAKWGADRLRLLVGPELREKFDRQRYLLNQAVWHGDLEAVRREAQRMVKGYLALDREATQAGAEALHPSVWEVALSDGSVAAVCRSNADASHVIAQGRAVTVYTLEEIARLLEGYPGLAKVKEHFPGAQVTAVRLSVNDPLMSVDDTDAHLDDPLPF